MKVVNMHDAKTTLSKLVEEAESGEEIIIARAGRPVVRLVPIVLGKKRKLGQWEGQVWFAEDFDAPLPPEMLRQWQGEP